VRRTQTSPLNTRLRPLLEKVFPAACFLPGLRVEENQRVFSIKPAHDEDAIGIQIDHAAMNWPPEQSRCDALFVCSTPDHESLAMVFVELKGGDVKKALDQILNSVRALCKGPNPVRKAHTAPVIDAVRSLHKQGHGNGIVGVIVSRRSIPNYPQERKRLRKQGIIVWMKTAQLRDVTCRELAEHSLRLR
jgi:hypothetical protein